MDAEEYLKVFFPKTSECFTTNFLLLRLLHIPYKVVQSHLSESMFFKAADTCIFLLVLRFALFRA